MKIGARGGIWLAVLAAGCALPASGQAAGMNQTAAQAFLSSSAPVQAQEQAAGEVVREIDDPHTGDRWLLLRDPSRPGGPGRMVLASAGLGRSRQGEPGDAQPPAALAVERTRSMPVIHTGDRLIVEEDNAVVAARLEAVALGPALSGAPLDVRLTIGGNVVRAAALGPGRAAFALETGSRP